MGCSSSKRVEATIDYYRPPPSSFAVFNINAIEEPWLKAMEVQHENDEKPTHVPAPILEKLNAIEDVPRTWDEVSKALEDLKPSFQQNSNNIPPPGNTGRQVKTKAEQPPVIDDKEAEDKEDKQTPRRNFSFHTLEELDAKLSSKPNDSKKDESRSHELKKENLADAKFKKSQSVIKPKLETRAGSASEPESRTVSSDGYKSVKDNIFILRDKQEREKEGKSATIMKFDPLSDFPERCPPDGADSVVIYTTSLGGVRRTFEDCNKIRSILESHQVLFDERDVSLHGKFLNELRELLDEGASVPRMFVKGRYIGGAAEVVSLNETGKLGRILNRARIEKGVGRLGCEGCGGARFIPCLDCGGSCKIVVGDVKERCPECNENGLVLCPLCA